MTICKLEALYKVARIKVPYELFVTLHLVVSGRAYQSAEYFYDGVVYGVLHERGANTDCSNILPAGAVSLSL